MMLVYWAMWYDTLRRFLFTWHPQKEKRMSCSSWSLVQAALGASLGEMPVCRMAIKRCQVAQLHVSPPQEETREPGEKATPHKEQRWASNLQPWGVKRKCHAETLAKNSGDGNNYRHNYENYV